VVLPLEITYDWLGVSYRLESLLLPSDSVKIANLAAELFSLK